MNTKIYIERNTRVVNLAELHQIIYIKHLGKQPYNEIKFECGKRLIVSYSLKYWHLIFQNFEKINKGVLVNPEKIISENGLEIVELIDNSKFTYSRRRFRDLGN